MYKKVLSTLSVSFCLLPITVCYVFNFFFFKLLVILQGNKMDVCQIVIGC